MLIYTKISLPKGKLTSAKPLVIRVKIEFEFETTIAY